MYITLERVNDSLWRFSIIVTSPGIKTVLQALQGKGFALRRDVRKHGHLVTETMTVEEALRE